MLIRIIVLTIYLLIVIFPLYWMLITSLKPRNDIYTLNIQYWPYHVTFQNYTELWRFTQFPIYLKNSIFVSVISSTLVLFFSILGGYALARYKFKWKNFTIISLLITQMIPTVLLIIPLYVIFSRFMIINTLISLIIFYTTINLPFSLLMMGSFFEQIPKSLEEAAMIDGCTKAQVIIKIVLPVMLPGIIAVFVFAFVGAWNELLGGVMFINSESLKTIPVGLNGFVGKFEVNWGQMSAGSILALIPTVIMFAFVQRYIVEGLTKGAVKE
ncbi:sugar ABC transporter permease [Thermoanaerobacter sp. YS13]|nr:sugar ABC transporter permease [Thermoanaerobacter sp. YS13]